MSKSKKIWIGILSFFPLLISLVLIIYMMTVFARMPFWDIQHNDGDVPPAWFLSNMFGMFIWIILYVFIHLGLMIYFIIHAINNPRVKSEERIIWVLVFIFTSSIGFPIYWVIRIWPEEKPESNFVKM